MRLFSWATFVFLVALSIFAAVNLLNEPSVGNAAHFCSLFFPALGVLGYSAGVRFFFRSFWLVVLVLSFTWAAYTGITKWGPHFKSLDPDLVVGIAVGMVLYNAAYIASFVFVYFYWRRFTSIESRAVQAP